MTLPGGHDPIIDEGLFPADWAAFHDLCLDTFLNIPQELVPDMRSRQHFCNYPPVKFFSEFVSDVQRRNVAFLACLLCTWHT